MLIKLECFYSTMNSVSALRGTHFVPKRSAEWTGITVVLFKEEACLTPSLVPGNDSWTFCW